jgi:hypothetical protein
MPAPWLQPSRRSGSRSEESGLEKQIARIARPHVHPLRPTPLTASRDRIKRPILTPASNRRRDRHCPGAPAAEALGADRRAEKEEVRRVAGERLAKSDLAHAAMFFICSLSQRGANHEVLRGELQPLKNTICPGVNS